MKKYIYFWGHQTSKNYVGKECLSQWYPSRFTVDGWEYFSAEQYMMAEKAKLFNDEESWKKIYLATDPKTIKQLGRNVKNFNSTIWDNAKFDIVVKGNYRKFVQNDKLKNYLLSTNDDILVEASPYDKVWGVGLRASDPLILDEKTWQGENLLGKALMNVRNDLYYGSM